VLDAAAQLAYNRRSLEFVIAVFRGAFEPAAPDGWMTPRWLRAAIRSWWTRTVLNCWS